MIKNLRVIEDRSKGSERKYPDTEHVSADENRQGYCRITLRPEWFGRAVDLDDELCRQLHENQRRYRKGDIASEYGFLF